eukprot:Gb_16428 [translate_table: standard]
MHVRQVSQCMLVRCVSPEVTGVMYLRVSKVNGDSAWPLAPVWPGVKNFTVELSVEDLGEPVYAWELPGAAGNACNGLTPTVALQLATVCSRFVADGAPLLKIYVTGDMYG